MMPYRSNIPLKALILDGFVIISADVKVIIDVESSRATCP